MAVLNNGFLCAEIAPKGATVTGLRVDGICVAERGSVQGRFANRIAGAEFTLNGRTYRLTANENGNILHGGPGGFARCVWEETQESETAAVYRLNSPDGDQGFPGQMRVEVRYALLPDALRIEYRAVSDADTVINLTNHAFFNLNGLDGGALHGAHSLCIAADGWLEVDSALIPTGAILPTADSRFDFRTERDYTENYDHCFVLRSRGAEAPAAVLRGKDSGLRMEVYTDLPGLQIFNTPDRICLETQELPDAIHHENFPSCVLRAGIPYVTATEYRFVREK